MIELNMLAYIKLLVVVPLDLLMISSCLWIDFIWCR